MKQTTLLLCAIISTTLGRESIAGHEFEVNDAEYARRIQPLLKQYCLACHSTKARKGDLDLERFDSVAAVRKDVRPWQQLIEQVESSEMPPKSKPQPTAEEREFLLAWVRGTLDAEARTRSGDPGRVPVRRLSNTEYDATIRDLTGVDLRPTREFPADGAAGEGFTNAAESLADITPTLFTRYLNAAKATADHAVLLPDGFRFSPAKTRRDWTDESTARLRKFYAEFAPDGRLAFRPYLDATVHHRDAIRAGTISLAEVAAREKLNPKYLSALWRTLNEHTTDLPLENLRNRWHTAAAKDVDALAAEVADWQKALWKLVAIGSYRVPSGSRQVPNNPAASDARPVRLAFKPTPGQAEVVIYLASRDLLQAGSEGRILWQQPRFEGRGKTTLFLKDYPQFGPAFEVDPAALFRDTARYLDAAAAMGRDAKLTPEKYAAEHRLDAILLKRWVTVLDLHGQAAEAERTSAASDLKLLDAKTPQNEQRPWLKGWRRRDSDLPAVLANSSDHVQTIPGTLAPHVIAVHPTPEEFVAVAWQSPLAARLKVSARIKHAHPACGNGVAWRLEVRHGAKARRLGQGTLELGREAKLADRVVDIGTGDKILLIVDAREANHFCDLTEIGLTIAETAAPGRSWDLWADVADSIDAGNPHADRHGNRETWSFLRGPSKPGKATPAQGVTIAAGSTLDRWRAAVLESAGSADELAAKVQELLTGGRPGNDKDPDRILYDTFVSPDSMFLKDLDLGRLARPRPSGVTYGLPADRFDGPDLPSANGARIEVRLPASLFRDREFLVEGKLVGAVGERVVVFDAAAGAGNDIPWRGVGPVVASPNSAAYKQLLAGFDRFRETFPWFLCFPNVVPTDEVVSLKMFHREDEPLERLFLETQQKARLDGLWQEHRFISQQPLAENNYLPQFIGFVTQDQPKSLVDYFEGLRPAFQKRADQFERDMLAAEPKQLTSLIDFADRAFRRPLLEREKAELFDMYRHLRGKGVSHEGAFRGVLTRILVAPAFLFRIEKAPAGTKAGFVDDWELATRLSYFLWSSLPDEELRRHAASGRLRDTQVLTEQTMRMLKDERLRALAIEFGAQWAHVRGFDALAEKNEKLYPTFTPDLRRAMYEEAILFFQDLFQGDRPVINILQADYTFLNEALAKHYGIPGVTGPQWRRVDGVRRYGRGGVLGLASVQSKQSGASRTSPVLRGNWVVETLLGEKLPRPPANVPILPDEESSDQLTTRQRVEKHVSIASCTVCHERIDPFGFAFENFDAIGRFRLKETNGQLIDARARLRDGAQFEGIDGLRSYLLEKKKVVVVRLFCQRLLGYALGRATTLSDTILIDEMAAELDENEGRISAAVLAIVRSPQFRMIRGRDAALDW